jgi:hypothetical protein
VDIGKIYFVFPYNETHLVVLTQHARIMNLLNKFGEVDFIIWVQHHVALANGLKYLVANILLHKAFYHMNSQPPGQIWHIPTVAHWVVTTDVLKYFEDIMIYGVSPDGHDGLVDEAWFMNVG